MKKSAQRRSRVKFTTKSFDLVLLALAIITISFILYFGGESLGNFPKRAKLTVFEGVKTSYEIPVMIVAFLPDNDNDSKVDEDSGYTGYYNQITRQAYTNSVTDLRLKIIDEAYEGAKYLTQATKYHGYKDPSAKPALTYNIRSNFIYESKENPPYAGKDASGYTLLDYKGILNKFDICKKVDDSGIKEIWIYAPERPGTKLTESNLSSKITSDISNSDRNPNDIPLCSKAYTVYTFDIKKGVEEMLYKKANQLQTLITEWPKADNLTEEVLADSLYWGKFAGANLKGDVVFPGCGYVKHAPNSVRDFDFFNTSKINSTCENFEGDIKTTYTSISCKTWSRYFYGNEECKVDGGISYLIWWMQNVPGHNNYVFYKGSKVRNWWDYIGDLERVYKHKAFQVLALNEQDESIPTFNGEFNEKPFRAESDDHLYTHPILVKPSKSTIEFPLDIQWGEVESAYYYIVKIDLREDGYDDIYEKKFSGNVHTVRVREKDLERTDNLYEGSILDITIMARSARYGDRQIGPVPFRLLSKRKMPDPQQVVVSVPKPTTASIPVATPKPVISPTFQSSITPSPIGVTSPEGNFLENIGVSSQDLKQSDLFYEIWDFIYGILEYVFYDFPVSVIKFLFSLF